MTCGDAVLVELHLPSGHPDFALRLCIRASSPELLHLQRQFHRSENHRHSGHVMAGMVLLLAVCGFIVGGTDGVRGVVAGGAVRPDEPEISPDVMERRFGARLLRPADMPQLFAHLREICRRAGLRQQPDLYYLPSPHSMNAYALGSARRSAIVLTQGLLDRMVPAEVAGILAHEVAHIRNNDGFAMTWATTLQRAVATLSLAALTMERGSPQHALAPLGLFLASAPAIGQLLYLALSRVRELDADALALELIDDPRSLATALHKLELFHAGSPVARQAAMADGVGRLLRSHPATAERVGILLRLAA
jgi:heat shock protein HtpX